MLQFLRNNTKLFAWFFVIVLILAFALSSFTFNKHDQYAGEVFGKKISFQEFRVFETMARLMAPSDDILNDPAMVRSYIWQQVILSREAKNAGIEVDDDEVRRRVDKLINPDENRKISGAEYQSLLKSWRTTPHEFETGVRETLRIQKLVATQFKPTADPTSVIADAADKKDIVNEAIEQKQSIEKDYMHWLTGVYQRAGLVDYSLLQSRAPAAEEPV